MNAWIRLRDRKVPPEGTVRTVRRFLFLPDYAAGPDDRMEWRWLGFQKVKQQSDGHRWWNRYWVDDMTPRELAKRIQRGEKWKIGAYGPERLEDGERE